MLWYLFAIRLVVALFFGALVVAGNVVLLPFFTYLFALAAATLVA